MCAGSEYSRTRTARRRTRSNDWHTVRVVVTYALLKAYFKYFYFMHASYKGFYSLNANIIAL